MDRFSRCNDPLPAPASSERLYLDEAKNKQTKNKNKKTDEHLKKRRKDKQKEEANKQNVATPKRRKLGERRHWGVCLSSSNGKGVCKGVRLCTTHSISGVCIVTVSAPGDTLFASGCALPSRVVVTSFASVFEGAAAVLLLPVFDFDRLTGVS
jgi:hypothetical protein